MTDAHAAPQPNLGLVAAGYVMALAFPPGGLVVGFLLAFAERHVGHAIAMIMLSTWAIMFVAWLLWGPHP